MRETAPKRAKTPTGGIVKYIGDHKWQRGLTAADVEEIRLREGSVDEHGMRRIVLEKDEPKYDRPKLRQYLALGYTLEEGEYEYILKMPQSEYEAKEKARHQQSYDRKKTAKPAANAEFVLDKSEPVGQVSAADVLAGRIPTVEGGVSVDEALAAMQAA